jgi:hypothetical protein
MLVKGRQSISDEYQISSGVRLVSNPSIGHGLVPDCMMIAVAPKAAAPSEHEIVEIDDKETGLPIRGETSPTFHLC